MATQTPRAYPSTAEGINSLYHDAWKAIKSRGASLFKYVYGPGYYSGVDVAPTEEAWAEDEFVPLIETLVNGHSVTVHAFSVQNRRTDICWAPSRGRVGLGLTVDGKKIGRDWESPNGKYSGTPCYRYMTHHKSDFIDDLCTVLDLERTEVSDEATARSVKESKRNEADRLLIELRAYPGQLDHLISQTDAEVHPSEYDRLAQTNAIKALCVDWADKWPNIDLSTVNWLYFRDSLAAF